MLACRLLARKKSLLPRWAANPKEGEVTHYYRPQTKFPKVVFSHVSVCPQADRCVSQHALGRGECAMGWQTKLPTPPPHPADITGCGQQAGGTHPTLMHSCFGHYFPETCMKFLKFLPGRECLDSYRVELVRIKTQLVRIKTQLVRIKTQLVRIKTHWLG